MLIEEPIHRILNIKRDLRKSSAPKPVSLHFIGFEIKGKLTVSRTVGLRSDDKTEITRNGKYPFLGVTRISQSPLFLNKIDIYFIGIEGHRVALIFCIEDEPRDFRTDKGRGPQIYQLRGGKSASYKFRIHIILLVTTTDHFVPSENKPSSTKLTFLKSIDREPRIVVKVERRNVNNFITSIARDLHNLLYFSALSRERVDLLKYIAILYDLVLPICVDDSHAIFHRIIFPDIVRYEEFPYLHLIPY